MLYYEVTIETNEELTDKIAEKCSVENLKDDKQKAILAKLNAGAKHLFGDNENKVLYFSDYSEKELTAIAGYKYECFSEIYDDILFIFKRYSQKEYNIKFNEITVEYFENKLNQISDMGYARIGLHNLSRRLKLDYRDNRTFSVKQTIIPENHLSYDDAVIKANEIMASGDYMDELKRIYSAKHPKEFFGHPVHYKISADEAESALEQARLLVHSLYSNGRVKSRRIDRIYKITDRCYDEDDMVNLFYNAEGGTVILELMPYNSGDSSYATAYEQVIDFLSSLIRKYAKNVLVIIIEIPKMQGVSKKLISQVADDIDIISISEGTGDANVAKRYMSYLIKNSSLSEYSFDDEVFNKERYKASEIHKMFNSWTKSSLKERIYTEYAKKSVKLEKKEDEMSDAYIRLQSMVGLNDVKAVIDNIIAAYKMQKIRNGYLKSDAVSSRHMIFTGNPGSAKTTVARLVAEILKNEGILETGEFVECGRADLIGKYVGWTAPAVKAKFRQAQGGVLFIDEAYSLVDNSGSFADEAINTIVQEMENHRDDVIVIFAGYPDQMKAFVEKNEGLKSRIAFHIDFPDYNAEELLNIMKLMMKESEYTMTPDAEKAVMKIFETAQHTGNFGNGRFARNVLEQAEMRQATRLMKSGFDNADDKETLFRLEKDDFNLPALMPKEEHKRSIGFVS